MGMTKKELVKQHLEECGKITSWEAIQLYRATRLSAIIFDLRAEGWDIETENHSVMGTNYAVYRLHTFKETLF